MTRKGKLEVFFNTEKEELKLIEKYEENIVFFNDLLKDCHKEDLEYVIPIKMFKYADPLIKKGYYTKAFKVLDEIERDLRKMKGQSKWYEIYSERVIFLKGVCFGRLKKYRESNKYFGQLIKKNPTNDNYIDWYKSNKKSHIDEIFNRIVYISLGAALTCLILDFVKIQNFRVPVIINVLIWAIVLLAFLAPYIWKEIIDKQKNRIK